MYGFAKANQEYERAMFFPYDDFDKIDKEEYEEMMADYALEEMRLNERWISFKSWPIQLWYRRRVYKTPFPRVIRTRKGV